jgi:prephenate dehydrogenase
MGGSLGLALARRRKWRVVGVGRNRASLRRAKALGAVHEFTTDAAQGVQGASVVVLAVPVDKIVPLAKSVRSFLAPHALLMDIGSVKGPIVAALDLIFAGPRGPRFVGAHPMAGSEKAGVEHARPDLYQGSICAITPGPRADARALAFAERFWRDVGCRTFRLPPAQHDRCVAVLSHLPHLLADALMLSAGRDPDAKKFLGLLSAGSFRDMTRVASADPEQWAAIFHLNAPRLRRAALGFVGELQNLIKRKWPLQELRRAKSFRDRYFQELFAGPSGRKAV